MEVSHVKLHNAGTPALNTQMGPDLKFKIAEAYKTARTNLYFSLVKEGCKKIVFTSSLSGEGKSTTAVNVAITLAQEVSTKVLLIDCDLRKPKVNCFFNMTASPGLTNFLGGMKNIDDVVRETDSPNLRVITGGVVVPNPSELLSSAKMGAVVKQMENKFDYIIFDTPPVNVVVDALTLAGIADGFVIVVKEGFSLQPELRRTIMTLEHAKVKILGVILNGAKLETKGDYGYRYEHNE
ncbi:MAG TPA: capsular biosynthesis protein [Clostridiales bacterium]|nr:capsular biosynthesis protein [Clostridiales bacterium]